MSRRNLHPVSKDPPLRCISPRERLLQLQQYTPPSSGLRPFWLHVRPTPSRRFKGLGWSRSPSLSFSLSLSLSFFFRACVCVLSFLHHFFLRLCVLLSPSFAVCLWLWLSVSLSCFSLFLAFLQLHFSSPPFHAVVFPSRHSFRQDRKRGGGGGAAYLLSRSLLPILGQVTVSPRSRSASLDEDKCLAF